VMAPPSPPSGRGFLEHGRRRQQRTGLGALPTDTLALGLVSGHRCDPAGPRKPATVVRRREQPGRTTPTTKASAPPGIRSGGPQVVTSRTSQRRPGLDRNVSFRIETTAMPDDVLAGCGLSTDSVPGGDVAPAPSAGSAADLRHRRSRPRCPLPSGWVPAGTYLFRRTDVAVSSGIRKQPQRPAGDRLTLPPLPTWSSRMAIPWPPGAVLRQWAVLTRAPARPAPGGTRCVQRRVGGGDVALGRSLLSHWGGRSGAQSRDHHRPLTATWIAWFWRRMSSPGQRHRQAHDPSRHVDLHRRREAAKAVASGYPAGRPDAALAVTLTGSDPTDSGAGR
jgi:hypothetical protein